ncbi:MAG TPA: GNAT family N-acetyltransferase [Gammaproteobacteria bacterium]|jgi:ribosomal protein S18 acetylase RimI-like enzyme
MATIRPFDQSDMVALRELVLELHEELRPFDRDLAPGEQIIDNYFRKLLTDVEKSSGVIFLCEEGGVAVGYVCLFGAVQPEDLDDVPKRYGFMAELYVKSGCRNRGIGQELVRHAEDYARSLGDYKMELKVLVPNEAARRFYESCGYTPRIVVMRKHL